MEGMPEIVFFDMETTVPNKTGQRFWVLEFGAIVVCPRKLVELESFSTLIRPADISAVALRSSRSNGITRQLVTDAPTFDQVSDKIFNILNGRIWAGHNIRRFDCIRIKESFAEIGKVAPQPVGIIDSLGVLAEKFGRRAGNLKMASLASYFNLGQQMHRSLDDVRMNLEVMKHCATVLFLESNLPNELINSSSRSSITTRSRSNGKLVIKNQTICRKSPPNYHPIATQRLLPYSRTSLGKVTEVVQNLMCKAQESKSMNKILKHSHYLLR